MRLEALALSFLAACSVPDSPAEGPRVQYRMTFAAGFERAALQKVVEIYNQRLGTLAREAAVVENFGSATVTVQLPVSAAFLELRPVRALTQALPAGEQRSEFSVEPAEPAGELARAHDEWLLLDEARCQRGLFGSTSAAHAAGTQVRLFDDARVRTLLGSAGEFELLEQASDEFLAAQRTSLAGERERFEAWRAEHPTSFLRAFDKLARTEGGPLPGSLWRRHRSSGEFALLVRAVDPSQRFGNRDVASAGRTQDVFGWPAVSFELEKKRKADFSAWTRSLVGHGLAIVLDDEILTLATVRSELPGGGVIEGGSGGFSKEEVKLLVELLTPSGMQALPLPPLSLEREFLR